MSFRILVYYMLLFFYFGDCTSNVINLTNINHDLQQFFTISLNGKTIDEFSEIQSDFQELVANLARDYCSVNDLKYNGSIERDTIKIHSKVPCPSEWLDPELCINIILSVPINTTSSYELTTKHIQALWQTHTASQLNQLGLQDYNPESPSDSTLFLLWLCATGGLLILFIIIAVIVLKTKCIENYIRQRKDILGSSNRSRMSQHKNHLVPPLFYPEPQRTSVTDSVENGLERSFGIENPGYIPDLTTKKNHQFQEDVIVDDFDSDEETIYPPYPLSRSTQGHLQIGRRNKSIKSPELETPF